MFVAAVFPETTFARWASVPVNTARRRRAVLSHPGSYRLTEDFLWVRLLTEIRALPLAVLTLLPGTVLLLGRLLRLLPKLVFPHADENVTVTRFRPSAVAQQNFAA